MIFFFIFPFLEHKRVNRRSKDNENKKRYTQNNKTDRQKEDRLQKRKEEKKSRTREASCRRVIRKLASNRCLQRGENLMVWLREGSDAVRNETKRQKIAGENVGMMWMGCFVCEGN